MKGRSAVVAVAIAVGVVGCGEDSCPTDAAFAEPGQDMADACSASAPQQVSIDVLLCEACSHTAPSCEADLVGLAEQQILLDTRWDVCTDDSSCSAQACASVTCTFAVPDGQYTVHAVAPTGTETFTLDVSGSSASCSGSI